MSTVAAPVVAAALRPRSGPELVDAAVSLTRRHIGPLATLAAISVMLDAAATAIRLTVAPGAGEFSGPVYLMLIVQFSTGGIMSGALARAASDAYLHGAADPARALREALRRAWTLAWAGVVIGLMIVFGLMLFIIPGLILVTRYFAVVPAIVLEGRGGWAAFRRSYELAAGRGWKLFLTVGLAYVLYFALMFGAELLAEELVGGEWSSTIAGATLGILLVPALVSLSVVAYYDARIEKEAFDLEMLAAAPGSPPEAAPVARALRPSAGPDSP